MKNNKMKNNNFEQTSASFNPWAKQNSSSSRKEKPIDENEINNSLRNIITSQNLEDYIPISMRKEKKCILNIGAKEYIPSKYKAKKEKIEQIVKKELKYTFEFIMQFENMEICNKTNLLSQETLDHINEIENRLIELDKLYPNEKINNSNCNTSISSASSNMITSLEQWARKNYEKEIKLAEENKKNIIEFDQKDAIKRELRAILNALVKDNYDELKEQILEIIKDNEEYQDQFLEPFFKKILREPAYSEIYAKLTKFLNKKLPQKNEKTKHPSSNFRIKLIDKCREFLKEKDFDKYLDEEKSEDSKNKLKKNIKGNVTFLFELIKMKLLSKKIMPEIADYLFERFKKENEKYLKLIFAETTIFYVDNFGTLMHEEEENMKPEDIAKYKEKLEENFKKLEIIKEDKSINGYIKCLIINLINKKENSYKKSKFEQSLIAKSKDELEKEKEKEKKEKELEKKEKEQEEINNKIKNDLNEYKEYVEEEGNSDKYSWKVTTDLYDVQYKTLDDILEGYILSSSDFIEKKDNIKYAKDYIKELIGFYNKKISNEEKSDLKERIFSLYEIVSDLALDSTSIYDVYAYVLFIFIENEIMEIEDLENIMKEKEGISILNKVLKYMYENNKSFKFKKELKKISFIKKNKGLFEWLFADN